MAKDKISPTIAQLFGANPIPNALGSDVGNRVIRDEPICPFTAKACPDTCPQAGRLRLLRLIEPTHYAKVTKSAQNLDTGDRRVLEGASEEDAEGIRSKAIETDVQLSYLLHFANDVLLSGMYHLSPQKCQRRKNRLL